MTMISSLYVVVLSILALQPAFSWYSSHNLPRDHKISINHHYRTSTGSSIVLYASPDNETNEPEYKIRDCQYTDLTLVVDVVMASFYPDAVTPWKQMYRLGELSRLQQGFPYSDPAHRMILAYNNSSADIVGFCDIDSRKPNRATGFSYNPRPYLSDLCVHPDHQRKGVAKQLVRACEEYCQTLFKSDHIYIRVDWKNTPAVNMYKSIGYTQVDAEVAGTSMNDNIVLLQKALNEEDRDISLTESRVKKAIYWYKR